MNLPEDGFLLLSVINTKLRDCYFSLEELCAAENLDKNRLLKRLFEIGYAYDCKLNAFKAVDSRFN